MIEMQFLCNILCKRGMKILLLIDLIDVVDVDQAEELVLNIIGCLANLTFYVKDERYLFDDIHIFLQGLMNELAIPYN